MRGKKNAEVTETVQEETSETNAKAEKVKTVKMVRDDGKTADVHPEEVANYALGGYKKA